MLIFYESVFMNLRSFSIGAQEISREALHTHQQVLHLYTPYQLLRTPLLLPIFPRLKQPHLKRLPQCRQSTLLNARRRGQNKRNTFKHCRIEGTK